MANKISHDLLKKLYMQKIQAIGRNDKTFLINLHQQYPELFDKRFLYEMLQNELKITAQKLPDDINKLLKEEINNLKLH